MIINLFYWSFNQLQFFVFYGLALAFCIGEHNAVKNNIETDMSSKSMRALVKMQISDMASWDIERYAIKGIPDSKYCYALGANASVVNPDEAYIAKAMDKIMSVQKGKTEADEN